MIGFVYEAIAYWINVHPPHVQARLYTGADTHTHKYIHMYIHTVAQARAWVHMYKHILCEPMYGHLHVSMCVCALAQVRGLFVRDSIALKLTDNIL